MTKTKKRLISLFVSAGILALLYWQIDFGAMVDVFRQSKPGMLAIALGMVIPLTLLTAWRFQLLVPRSKRDGGRVLSLWQSTRLILEASVLNMVLPAKAGDIIKAFFVVDRTELTGSEALSLVVFEKASDLLSLLLWCGLGLWILPKNGLLFWGFAVIIGGTAVVGLSVLLSKRVAALMFGIAHKLLPAKVQSPVEKIEAAWGAMREQVSQPGKLFSLAGLSIFIWFLHLLQIWLFILALGAFVPLTTNMALAPLAILAGLLPLTFAGVGTRDAALVVLFAPYFAAPVAAALGVLCTMRYVLPAALGLPFFARGLSEYRQAAARTAAPENAGT